MKRRIQYLQITMGINMFPTTRRKGKNGVKIEKEKASTQ